MNREIIDYAVVTEEYMEPGTTFDSEIKEWIKSGWQPLGGAFTQLQFDKSVDDFRPYLAQAMVKYAPDQGSLL